MTRPEAGSWWRGLLPKRRRGGVGPAVLLPDGSPVPASFAAALLGRRERAAVERRRRGFQAPVAEASAGTLARTAWGAGVRPSVDTIGPRAEVLLRTWIEEVDKEPPEILAAVEGEGRVAFFLKGWITRRRYPRGPTRDQVGNVVSFRVLQHIEPSGAHALAGTALVAASVRGPQLPRLRPSPTVAADGLLVPVGFTEEGCLYLPLLGSALAVSGEGSAELLAALCVYAVARMGPDACGVAATERVRSLIDPLVPTEVLDTGDPEEFRFGLSCRVYERDVEFQGRWADTYQEAALSGKVPGIPVLLMFLDAPTSELATGEIGVLGRLGVATLIHGEVDGDRSIALAGDTALVRVTEGLEPIPAAPALLGPETMAEAAVVLRGAFSAGRPETMAAEQHPTAPQRMAEEEPVTAATRHPKAPTASELARKASRRILCLGGLRVFLGPEAVEGGWRKKALELLALLASHPEGQSREQVLTALWPDREAAKSGVNLRQCLRQIRQRLEAAEDSTMVIDWVDQRLRLDAEAVWSDVRAFREAVKAARSSADPLPELQRAVDLYQGPFCQGQYYDWDIPVREFIQREFVEASTRLAQLLVESGREDEALRVIDRTIEHEPFAEHLYRLAIQIEAKRGRPAAARRRYEALKRLLRAELGTEPTEETEAAYRSIR